jgi:hypothetical protein
LSGNTTALTLATVFTPSVISLKSCLYSNQAVFSSADNGLSDNTVQSEEAIKAFLFDLSPAIALSKAPLAQAVASACLCAISCAVSSI